jgi:hypothetical protein
VDKKQILDEIRRTAEENGGIALGRTRFLQETGIREIDWKGKYWINWSDAVAEAGVNPNIMNEALDDELLLHHAATLVRELGHFPQRAELNLKRRQDSSFPSEKTFRRFGGKGLFANAVMQWCEDQDSWVDVVALCKPIAKAANLEPRAPTPDPSSDGFVYLMKSGRHYKIGFTNSLDRNKHLNGEWFSLSPQDVAAFKRRKFM